MPKISIIVPVYKVEKYLHRCLDSVKNQNFTDWECILIDDGSPDDSGKICDEYAEKDERFIVIHQENAGVSAARNKGLDEAKGEWICFVDSDDWIKKEMLFELFECAVKHQADVVVCGCTTIDETHKCSNFCPTLGWLNIPRNFEWYMQGPWAKLFKYSTLINNGIRFPLNITLAEDLFFVFQTFYHTRKIFGINQSLYNYFINSNSVTRRLTKKNICDQEKMIKEISHNLMNDNNAEWEKWLILKKNSTKNLAMMLDSSTRYVLWWKIFPEVNYCFKYLTLKQKVIKFLIITRLYTLYRLVCRK